MAAIEKITYHITHPSIRRLEFPMGYEKIRVFKRVQIAMLGRLSVLSAPHVFFFVMT